MKEKTIKFLMYYLHILWRKLPLNLNDKVSIIKLR